MRWGWVPLVPPPSPARDEMTDNMARVSSRFFGLDSVRGFAVVAMVVAHTVPFTRPAPKVIEFAQSLLNVATPLFAIIIGVTIALTGPAPIAVVDQRRRYRRQLVVKALALIGLGVLLDLRFSGVVIVLAYLGVALLAALPFLFVRARTLLICAAALFVLGPGIITWLRVMLPSGLMPHAVFNGPLLPTLLDWAVLGRSYQALNLVPRLLLGVLIGRTILHQRRPIALLLAVSFVAFVVMRLWQASDLPGSGIRGGYVEVGWEVPLALGALACILFLTELAPHRALRVIRPVFEPLAVQGRLALSVYVLHVLILMCVYSIRAGTPGEYAHWFVSPRGWLIQIGLVLVCWAFAAAWWRWMGAGPIERVLGVLNGRHPVSSLLQRRSHAVRRAQTGSSTGGASVTEVLPS